MSSEAWSQADQAYSLELRSPGPLCENGIEELEVPHTPAADRYERMTYRRCGRSGLRLPAISLGAWETFGGYKDESVARDCFFPAFDLGVTHFDFANNYGRPPGNAELVCGRILRELPRDELIISSK